MAWLFLLGVIITAVFHEGFRKVCFWALGAGVAVLLIGAFAAYLSSTH